MFGDAVFNGIIPTNPCMLQRGTLKGSSKQRAAYRGADVEKLLSERVSITRRLFVWIAFFTGMREGEICGRRFRDWIRAASPLWSPALFHRLPLALHRDAPGAFSRTA